MKTDRENQYSGAQALTATAASTDIVDHGADRNIGIGEPMCVLVTVDVAADGTTGDETYTAKVETDDNAAFGSPTTISMEVTIPRTAVAGDKFAIPIPPDTNSERFTRVKYTLGGTTPTLTATARLVPQKFLQNNVVYPKGYTIS